MVAHLPRPFGCAGDLRSGFPELSMPSTLPVSAGFQVALVAPASSCNACNTVLRLPPRSVPPASPVMDRRVAPILASFGGAGCESSRLPLHFASPVSPTISIQVAPDAHPPAPAGQLSESPRIRSIRFALFESPDCSVDSLWTSSIDQSPSRLGSFSLNVADSVCLESPRNFLPRLIRICFRRLRLLPHLQLGR